MVVPSPRHCLHLPAAYRISRRLPSQQGLVESDALGGSSDSNVQQASAARGWVRSRGDARPALAPGVPKSGWPRFIFLGTGLRRSRGPPQRNRGEVTSRARRLVARRAPDEIEQDHPQRRFLKSPCEPELVPALGKHCGYDLRPERELRWIMASVSVRPGTQRI